VTTGSSGSIWRRFEHDPRDPAYATLRAADRDRAVVHDVLVEAYGDGRIDREEFDERSAQVTAAKTYADLVPPIRDLTADASSTGVVSVPAADLQRQARLYYGEKVREAFFGLLVPNLICWAIWYFVTGRGFIWPIFVSIPTTLNFLKVATSRGSIVQARVEKLQRREAKALEAPKGAAEKAGGTSEEILDDTREEPEEA
jgi:hypothetical protein